jgi:hypothetical protein
MIRSVRLASPGEGYVILVQVAMGESLFKEAHGSYPHLGAT